VLLDTTQDYYALSWPTYRELVDVCLAGATELREALLFAAGPEALFGLVDRLVHAVRTCYTQGELDHNEFIAQGMLTRWARELLEPPPDTYIVPRARRRAFADLCAYVRCFLDVHLAGRPGEELAALDGVYRESWLGGVAPHVEHVPRGTDGPEPFEPSGHRLVTPRQFARILRDEGVEAALVSPLRGPDFHLKSEVLRSSMLMGSLLRDLVQEGREDDARRLYAGLEALGARPLSVFPFQADMAELLGRPERGIDALRTYLVFEPDDADVRARLEALEARQDGR
jgi:hypothetical protein